MAAAAAGPPAQGGERARERELGGTASLARASARTAVPCLVVASVALVGWHLPVLYDATLRNQGVHDIEHLLFVGTSLLSGSA